jgi:Flp pilus assembly pilin Flp
MNPDPINWRTRLRRLIRHQRGAAGIEAALILPVMVFFIMATVELYQYFRVVSILDRAVFTVADGIAMQAKTPDLDGGPCTAPNHICTYGAIMGKLMSPVDYARGGQLIMRLYWADGSGGGTPVWSNAAPGWSRTCNGAGDCTVAAASDSAPDGMPPPQPNDTVVVVQARQHYEPFIISSKFWTALGGSVDLSTTVFYRPRFDDLKSP